MSQAKSKRMALPFAGLLDDAVAYRFVKRLFDVAFSAGVLVVGAVPSVILCAVIAADLDANPIYTQVRAGRNGEPFHIIKFRTMVPDADDVSRHLTPDQMKRWQCEMKVEDDSRTTKLGSFLRSTSIDEFPQFANVLLGQMSIVGPRPITFHELEWFGEDRDEPLSCRPGITGLWQTGPRNKALFETGERQKIELEYVRTANLALDAKIFMRTFRAIAKRTGL